MGQDIHWRVYGKSKITGKGINLSTLGVDDKFYEGRCYDLFSVFGSTRSFYPVIQNINFGLPEDVMPPEEILFFHDYSDYHTHSWFRIGNLMNEIELYRSKLENPGMFILDDDFTPDTFKIREFCDSTGRNELMKNSKSEMEDRESVSNSLKHIYERLEWAKDEIKDIEKYIIPESATVLIFFDN